MFRRFNPRFRCAHCRRWTIRRSTRNTRRIAYHASLCRLCIQCYLEGLAVQELAQELAQQFTKLA